MSLFGTITLPVAIAIVFGVVIYNLRIKNLVISAPAATNEKSSTALFILYFLALALIVKVILAYMFEGYQTDMTCFRAWSMRMLERGPAGMYEEGYFADYPPGYFYILWAVAKIGQIFKMNISGEAYRTLLKLPAVLCDIGLSFLVYAVAKKRLTEIQSIMMSLAYALNPFSIIDSSVWGQVDSVALLFIALMVYFITEEKLPAAYFAIGLGVLIKPQILFFGPILLYAIIEQVFLRGFDKKKFWTNLISGLIAIGVMVLLALPFGLPKVWETYMNTLGSYKYATVNAYNFWAMLGLNWRSLETARFLAVPVSVWGNIFLVLIVLAVMFVLYKGKNKCQKYYFGSALIMMLIFCFSAKMHERYMFPSVLLILLCFVTKPQLETWILFYSSMILGFMNAAHVLFFYDPHNFSAKTPMTIFVSVGIVAVVIAYIFFTVKEYILGADDAAAYIRSRAQKNKIIQRTDSDKIEKKDLVIMAVVTLVYAIVAFARLGSFNTPSTEYIVRESNHEIMLDFGEEVTLSGITYYLGNYERREMYVWSWNEAEQKWEGHDAYSIPSVFKWNSQKLPVTTRYLDLICTNNALSLFEIGFLDENENVITPVNTWQYPELFDEQDTIEPSSFKNGTYFDEIYYARTGYEMNNGRYTYENTHPPFGKVLIALGMRIFGTNPVGWRFMGVFFGVLMLPFIYLFAKKLFKDYFISSAAMIIFAFDFMHFAQTRIATIDVFVTFFIILMYYFMYLYVTKDFYDKDIKKALIPLGLCGISFGFGAASKWTGLYAGAGLAVIFFYAWAMHLYQYICAKKAKEDNALPQAVRIREQFVPNTVKTFLFCILMFIVVPALIYTLSYIRFDNGTEMGLIQRMLKNQVDMYNYHSKLEATHPYSSVWYEWPIMIRPIYYYQRTITKEVSEAISSFGNPLVWWAGIPAFFVMIVRAIKGRDKKAAFLCVGYLAQYIPWMFVDRCTFIYHYFPAVAFVVLMIAYWFKLFVDEKPERIKWLYVYVVAVVILFILFYPVLSGLPVSKSWVASTLKWFDSWVLIS